MRQINHHTWDYSVYASWVADPVVLLGSYDSYAYLTCHFCASLKHKYNGQTKFIKPDSEIRHRIIKYWVSIGSIHREQG